MSRAIVKKEAKRYAIVIFGAFLFSVGMNCFIVPLNLYSSGVLGIAQIIRTLLQQSAGLHFQMGYRRGFEFCLQPAPVFHRL